MAGMAGLKVTLGEEPHHPGRKISRWDAVTRSTSCLVGDGTLPAVTALPCWARTPGVAASVSSRSCLATARQGVAPRLTLALGTCGCFFSIAVEVSRAAGLASQEGGGRRHVGGPSHHKGHPAGCSDLCVQSAGYGERGSWVALSSLNSLSRPPAHG